MRFRKSIKIAKGLRINIGSKGISSVSVGGKGLTLNASKKGVRATASIPGSGLSQSGMLHTADRNQKTVNNTSERPVASTAYSKRKVGFFLAIGILIVPYIFGWFTLRKGHSKLSRILSFLWMGCFLFIVSQ